MKKIFKRICSLILAIAIVLPSVPMKTFALLSGSIGGVYWDVTGNDLTISGSGYMADGSPWVAAIDDYYQYNTNVQGIRHISYVEIKDGVKNIGNNAFKNHTGLSEVTIPSSVISIGNYAFYGCNRIFYEITLTEGVETIGKYAFADCSELRRVDVPSTVKSIGEYAFMSCSNLLVVSVPEGVTSIGSGTFAGCSSLENIIIPESVTTIGQNAFSKCSSLKSITIPKSVMTIEPNTFFECSNLETIYYSGTKEDWDSLWVSAGNEVLLNANVIYNVVASGYCGSERVGGNWGHENDLVWVLDSAGTLTISGNGDMVKSGIVPWREYYDQIKSVVIKSGVTSIGNYGFKACSTLTSATIPDSVTSIPGYMFMECTSLKSVTIPDSVTVIPVGMFYGCSALENVTIPGGVKSIGSEAFYGCSSLTSIVAPGTIGSYAFANCSSLTSVTIDSIKTIAEGVFANCGELKTVYYLGTEEQWAEVTIKPENESLLNAHIICRLDYDKDGAISWTINSDGLLTISGTGDMKDYYPNETTSPPWYMYRKQIKEVIIQSGITHIGANSFYGCEALTSITIPESVVSIGEYAFFGCSSLTSITLPEGVTIIEKCTFGTCMSLTSVVIPTSVTAIRYGAFGSCKALTSITIPESVTLIGSETFKGCSSLTSITIPSGVTSIGDAVFENCTSLTSVTIPEGVTSVGSRAFYYCTALTSVTIPTSVTSIGDSAFYECPIENVYYYGSLSDYKKIRKGDKNNSIKKSVCISEKDNEGNDIWIRCGDCGHNLVWTLDPEGVLTISGAGATWSYTSSSRPSWYNNRSEIRTVVIEAGVTSIGDYTFYNCTLENTYYLGSLNDLSKLQIGSSNTSLINSLYISVENNEGNDIWVRAGTCGENLIWTLDPEGVLTISGAGAMASYTYYTYSCPPWDNDQSEIRTVVIEDGVTSIGSYAFYNYSALTNVTIPSSVTSIEDSAFRYCTLENTYYLGSLNDLSKLQIGSSNTSLINSLYISVENNEGNDIWVRAGFCGDNLIWVLDTEGVLTISGAGAMASYASYTSSRSPWYNNRSEITTVIIEAGVTSIGDYAFYSHSALTNVTIPSSVTSIGTYAFNYCNSLTDVYYSGSSDEWNAIDIASGNNYLINATIHYPVSTIPDFEVNSTATSATITAPEGGWVEGENTFTVSNSSACYVVVSYDGGQTYTRLPATAAGDAYAFTAENMDADTIIAVGLVGDLNGDGRIRAQEARQVLQASSGSTELTALQTIVADLNGDGRIRAQEARTLLQASSGSATLNW